MRNFFSLGDWDRRSNSHPFGYMQNDKPKKSTDASSFIYSKKAFTVIKEDGTEISRSRHRHVLYPDADISGEHAEVQAIANAAWTDDVKAAYKTFKDNQTL